MTSDAVETIFIMENGQSYLQDIAFTVRMFAVETEMRIK